MDPYFFGSLVLQAKCRVSDFPMSVLRDGHTSRGQHVPGTYNGHWSLTTNIESQNLYLPQRYKHMHVMSTESDAASEICNALNTLDSEYEGARQLYKLGKMLDGLNSQNHATLVNIEASTDAGSQGSFYLLSAGQPIFVCLVMDQKPDERSVRLLFSTFDPIPHIRLACVNEPNRYVFFRFPNLVSRPLFLWSSYMCKRWYSANRDLQNNALGLITACNALENQLYKDHTSPY